VVTKQCCCCCCCCCSVAGGGGLNKANEKSKRERAPVCVW
jgi:streptolysin S family bacteriocin protoxin